MTLSECPLKILKYFNIILRNVKIYLCLCTVKNCLHQSGWDAVPVVQLGGGGLCVSGLPLTCLTDRGVLIINNIATIFPTFQRYKTREIVPEVGVLPVGFPIHTIADGGETPLGPGLYEIPVPHHTHGVLNHIVCRLHLLYDS